MHASPARRPISLPGSCRLRIHFRLRRDSLPHPPCLRPRHTLCRNGAPVHDMHRRTHRSRWLAGSYYLGRHGIGHYGMGARLALARLRNSARARTTKTFTEENSRARRSEESRLSAPTIKKSQGVSSKESMKKSDTAEDGIKG